jgi:hypothetical protein
MLGIKKQPIAEQVRFADADKFVANSYHVSHVEFGCREPPGVWTQRFYHDDHRAQHPDYGVSVICGTRPNTLFDARNTWLVALTVRTESKAIATAVDALITNKLRWREGVTTKRAPVRGTTGRQKALYVFAFDDATSYGDTHPFTGRESREYDVPKVKGRTSVEVGCALYQFAASGLDVDNAYAGIGYDPDGAPFYWRGGVDLTQVRRTELPLITEEGAGALFDSIVNIFESHGATVAY